MSCCCWLLKKIGWICIGRVSGIREAFVERDRPRGKRREKGKKARGKGEGKRRGEKARGKRATLNKTPEKGTNKNKTKRENSQVGALGGGGGRREETK